MSAVDLQVRGLGHTYAGRDAPALDRLSSAVGEPQIVKVLFYAEWGMQAMNARPIGDLLEPFEDDVTRSVRPRLAVRMTDDDESANLMAVERKVELTACRGVLTVDDRQLPFRTGNSTYTNGIFGRALS